jgi:ribokinase
MKKIDFLAIGDITLDTFIKIKKAEVNCPLNKENCKLSLDFGQKIPYEEMQIMPAAGNSSNAAICAAKLGLRSALVSFIGYDENGKNCLKSLRENGVSTKYIKKQKNRKTNSNFVLWYDSDRTILTKHTQFDYFLPRLKKVSWIYLSSLPENSLNYTEEIVKFLEKNPETKLAFQPGSTQIKLGIEKLKRIYEHTEIFFSNLEEAQKITAENTTDISTLAQKISSLGPKIVIISDSKNGAYLYAKNELYYLPIFEDVNLIDKTGAGDAFSASIVAGLIYGKNIFEAFAWGPVNAMSVIQKVGAQNGLLSKKELETFLKKSPKNYQVKKIT